MRVFVVLAECVEHTLWQLSLDAAEAGMKAAGVRKPSTEM
jgi:hypothetical protein